jgi:hypothetical protein
MFWFTANRDARVTASTVTELGTVASASNPPAAGVNLVTRPEYLAIDPPIFVNFVSAS